jgi:general secretion pathway protein K
MSSHPARFSPVKTDRQRGSVILFVLGLVLLTALLLTRFIERANTELLAESRFAQLPALRDEAYSTLQVTLAVLADFSAADNGLHAPAQGWDDPLTYAGYTPPDGFQTTVRIEDETGKLSLPDADAASLQELLVTAGCLPLDAQRVSDAILSWSRPDHTAQFSESDDDTYQQLDPAITPPHAALQSFAELQLIPAVRDLLCNPDGSWNGIGQRFLASVSLYSFNHINLNTVGPDVLAALGLQADALLAQREDNARKNDPRGAGVFYALSDASSALNGSPDAMARLGVDVSCLRVVITTRQGGRKFQLVAVVQPGAPGNGGTAAPAPNTTATTPRSWTTKSIDSAFRILEIRENNGF